MARYKLSRRDIKHDEFVSTMARAIRWIEDHHKILIWTVVGTVLAVVLAGVGQIWWVSQRDKALAALSVIEERYHASVTGEQAPIFQNPTDQLTYESRDEKLNAVLEAVDSLTEHFSTGPAVRQALYYRALTLRDLGRYDEASITLEDLIERRMGPLPRALARVALAEIYEAAGRWSDAEGAYRKLFDEAPVYFPREMALLGRARCLQRNQQQEQARAVYQQIVDAYPDSPYGQEAEQRLREMG
ncbi:MAG: tetratricopeptide repeat protein [Acidobacteriota bacterium]